MQILGFVHQPTDAIQIVNGVLLTRRERVILFSVISRRKPKLGRLNESQIGFLGFGCAQLAYC